MNDIISMLIGFIFGLIIGFISFILLIIYLESTIIKTIKLENYEKCYKFVKHVQNHLKSNQVVICKICGKQMIGRI